MELKKLTQEEINKILELHEKWLAGEKDGEQADFSYCDLPNKDFSHLNLNSAIFIGSNLENSTFEESCLENSIFNKDFLYQSNFRFSILRDSSFIEAILCEAVFEDADLFGAILIDSDLTDIKINENTLGIKMVCPETGTFIGYKKAGNRIVILEIPDDAQRSSATTLACRCSKAKVLGIENLKGKRSNDFRVFSNYDKTFVYEVGNTVEVHDFDTNRWKESTTGIHFFMNKIDIDISEGYFF